MKKNILFSTLILFTLNLAACEKNNISESSAKYPIENGEVVINDSNLTKSSQPNDNNRVFYQIFTGSFSDSNGDGKGDLQGIINRLDYLNDGDPNSGKSLGIQGIWLTPIFSSPTYHKYDVLNYYNIDSDFGNLETFKNLVSECHKRNIKLILDLPINHSSNLNNWFIEFKKAVQNNDVSNQYYDFYSKATNATKINGCSYSLIPNTQYYYECNFDSAMPELNFDNQLVKQEVLNIAKYWLDLGVDGFRFDAAKYIYYGNNPQSADFWNWYISELKAIKEDIYTIGEVWDGDGITDIYFKNGLDCFNFSTSGAEGKISLAAKSGNVTTFTNYIQTYKNKIEYLSPDSIMHSFISNHDMDRSAGYLKMSSNEMRVAASLYLLSPGSPFIYYGEEIAMKGSRGSANTDANRRLAMLWGDDDTIKDPIGTTYRKTAQINGTVASQKGDKDSLLNHYKKLIMIRNACPEIASGNYNSLKSNITTVGGFISTINNSSVCVLHNTSTEVQTFEITDLTTQNFNKIFNYAGTDGNTFVNNIITIQPQTTIILK